MAKGFNTVELEDMAKAYIEEHDVAELLLVGEANAQQEQQLTELQLVEWYADDFDLISSEQMLSVKFDLTIEGDPVLMAIVDDAVQVNHYFNVFADLQVSSGNLHNLQCDVYCYVGKFGGGNNG